LYFIYSSSQYFWEIYQLTFLSDITQCEWEIWYFNEHQDKNLWKDFKKTICHRNDVGLEVNDRNKDWETL
jgi:hypothetical protein